MGWRYGWVGVVGVLALSLPGLLGCGGTSESTNVKPQEALDVEIEVVGRRPIESSLEAVGTLFPWKFATIGAEVTGVIEMIPDSKEKIEYEIDGTAYEKVLSLDIGHPVRQGDMLVQIDTTEPELSLRAAQAKLQFVEKELANLLAWKRAEEVDQIQAQFDESEAILEDAEADLRRAEQLRAKQALSSDSLGDYLRAVSTARAGKKRAQAALELAKAGPTAEQVAMAEAQLAMAKADVALKQDKLEKCTIRCPLENARIVERYVSVGDHVTANPVTPIMRIVDSSILMAQVGVPERYQGLIRPNDEARVRAEGIDAPGFVDGYVHGKVVLVNAQIDPETRTFRVRVGIDNSHGSFTAGTFIKVRLSTESVTDIAVPSGALTFATGDPWVFVCREGRVEKRPVVLGISDRAYYQVLSGLSENEQVVLGDLSLLATGRQVRPKTARVNP